jgi:hypothetical protein
MRLSESVAGARTLALFGLAKNAGKTEALMAIVRELRDSGQIVGVTSIGRDGETLDVIDSKIRKPSICLTAGSLVATTDWLLHKSGLRYDLLQGTRYRTPLGRVLIGRLRDGGPVEVAGPTAVEDVKAVCDAMIQLGADRVLVDGAINRRAASSPLIADAVVISTGAVLDADIDEVVKETKEAIDLLRLPAVQDPDLRRLSATACSSGRVERGGRMSAIPYAAVLGNLPSAVDTLVREQTAGGIRIVIAGSVCESFLANLQRAARGRDVLLVVSDASKIFLGDRPYQWYAQHGIRIEVLWPTEVKAITVNPIAPRSHQFSSPQLRARIQGAIPGVLVVDVKDPSYASS